MADFNQRFAPSQEYGPGKANSPALDAVMKDRMSTRAKQMYNRSLIDSAFPSAGSEQRAHEGSQSDSPNKEYQ